MRTVCLQDYEASIGIRSRRSDQQVHRHGDVGAWLEGDEAPKAVVDVVDVVHLVQHGRPGISGAPSIKTWPSLALAMDQQEFEMLPDSMFVHLT